jgi:hypothetical protein
LPQEERSSRWEQPAADRLEAYKKEFESYKETAEYHNYQQYLEGFYDGNVKPGVVAPSDDEVASSSPSASGGVQSHSASGALRSDSETLEYTSGSMGIDSQLLRIHAMPDEDCTTHDIESFLRGTGSLLYLWKREEALELIESVYRNHSTAAPVDAMDVLAMSAVGNSSDRVADVQHLSKTYVHLLEQLMSAHTGKNELRRMRVLACLAICYFTSDANTTRAYMCTFMIAARPHENLTGYSVFTRHWPKGTIVHRTHRGLPRIESTPLGKGLSEHRLSGMVGIEKSIIELFLLIFA